MLKIHQYTINSYAKLILFENIKTKKTAKSYNSPITYITGSKSGIKIQTNIQLGF